jgi:hypothetical protein
MVTHPKISGELNMRGGWINQKRGEKLAFDPDK